MSNTTKDKATICIVNYKTPDLIKLCLRSIRKFTEYPYEVIVIDNDSQDESLQYLKSLDWIRLIERCNKGNDKDGGYSHAAALDLGLQHCRSEFFVSMHSDTFVCKRGWLKELVSYFGNNGDITCVGSGKIELSPLWQVWLKKATDFKTFKRKILRRPDPNCKFRYYNRTICCLYRTSILKAEKLSFLMDRDKGLTGGKKLYFELVDGGYKTVELPSELMSRYVLHLAHATQAVNSGEFNLNSKTIRKFHRITNKITSSEIFKSIMEDDTLDR